MVIAGCLAVYSSSVFFFFCQFRFRFVFVPQNNSINLLYSIYFDHRHHLYDHRAELLLFGNKMHGMCLWLQKTSVF